MKQTSMSLAVLIEIMLWMRSTYGFLYLEAISKALQIMNWGERIFKCKIDRAQVVPNLHILHESVGSFLNDPTNCQNLWRIFVEHEPLDPSHQDHLCHIYDFGVEESCYWIVMKCQNITITSHCIRHPQIIQDSHDFPDFESFNQWKKIQVLRYNPQKVARLAGVGCHRNWVCH